MTTCSISQAVINRDVAVDAGLPARCHVKPRSAPELLDTCTSCSQARVKASAPVLARPGGWTCCYLTGYSYTSWTEDLLLLTLLSQ